MSLMSGMCGAEANIALACFSKLGELKKKFELPREKNFFSCSFEVVIKSGYIQPWVEGSLWKCAVPGVAVQPRVPPGRSLQSPRCGQRPPCWGGMVGAQLLPWLWAALAGQPCSVGTLCFRLVTAMAGHST